MDVIIVGTIVVAVGGFVQASLGFGFGMVSVPPLLMMLSAAQVIPMQIALSLFLAIPLAARERSHLNPKLVGPLLVSAFVGLPVGMIVLDNFDGPFLKIAVGVILVLMSAAMFNGWSYTFKRQLPVLFPVGFLSGVMQTSISMAGPPIILFLTNQDTEKSQFRGNILMYFAVLGSISTVTYTVQGAYDAELLRLIAIFLPTTILGGIAGERAAKRIPQLVFRRITLGVATLMGLLLVLRNAVSLFV